MHVLGVLMVLTAGLSGPLVAVRNETACTTAPLYDNGKILARVCTEKKDVDVALLNLDDEWTPGIFSETPERPQIYRGTFVALANDRIGEGRHWDPARRDRYFELFGIFPSISVIRRRLLDETRHRCHATIDDAPLGVLRKTLTPWDSARDSTRKTGAGALAVVQQHLLCEGLLAGQSAKGVFDGPTLEALRAYQRRHMLPSASVLDGETRETFLTNSRELDFRTLLRALRERVVDATGLIEDGSARNSWEPILGRMIESREYRQPMRPLALQRGAPDLVARATEAAAIALGWTSPEDAFRMMNETPPSRVAVRLPPLPAYHAMPGRLRAEIDRGDVWTSYPRDAEGRPRPSPARNRPTLTLYLQTNDGEIALLRWPTTIGSWKPEKLEDGTESLRYKDSPVGRRYWRDLVVAPAWFPPPTTPDRELVRRGPNGTWVSNEDGIGPGYRSAYGLIALFHHRAVATKGGATVLADIEIRTHGSGNYRSILRGASHGCHRLFNHLAIRLGSFVLAHSVSERRGLLEARYRRVIHWKGRAFKLRAESRGYRYELIPPIPVDVLPGRTVRSKPTPVIPDGPTPAVPRPQTSLATSPKRERPV